MHSLFTILIMFLVQNGSVKQKNFNIKGHKNEGTSLSSFFIELQGGGK